ncbi:MAG: 50S ribosomal protein L32, partial [Candidatus Ventricola sp.]
SAPGIVKCPRCQQMKLAHRICKHCGYYDGRQVINMEAETASEK